MIENLSPRGLRAITTTADAFDRMLESTAACLKEICHMSELPLANLAGAIAVRLARFLQRHGYTLDEARNVFAGAVDGIAIADGQAEAAARAAKGPPS